MSVTLIVVGVIVWQLGGLGEVGRLIASIDMGFVVLILMVMMFDRVLMTYKWVRLLRGRGEYLPLLQGLQIYCAAMVWGMFLPTTMGADALRAFSTARKGLNSNEVVASILIERMIGLLVALSIGLFSLLLLSLSGVLDERFRALWLAAAAVFLAGILAFLASFSQRGFDLIHDRIFHRFQHNAFFRKLRQFHHTYLAYQHDKANLAVFFALTFLEQLMPLLFNWLIVIGLGIQVNLLYVAGAVSLTYMITRIPISIDGLGVYEGIFALLMSLVGVSMAQSIAITLIGRILQIIVWLPWWAAYVIDIGSLRPPQPVAKGAS